jgi:solute carrier family 25 S-adenosylmethionine transporter 26
VRAAAFSRHQLLTLFSAGAFWTTYEGAKTLLHSTNLLPTPLVHTSASALAELVACAISTPAETLKQNAQMVQAHGAGTGALRETLGRFRSNPAALWRGYGALVSRNLPFVALQFPLFERLRTALAARRGGARTLWERGWTTGVAGGVAGALAAAVTTPVDVVKTRIMLAAAETGGGGRRVAQALKNGEVVDALGAVRARRGSADIAREILREQGWRGLFRGGTLRCVWSTIASGLYLGVYESARMYLRQRREESS